MLWIIPIKRPVDQRANRRLRNPGQHVVVEIECKSPIGDCFSSKIRKLRICENSKSGERFALTSAHPGSLQVSPNVPVALLGEN